MRHILIFDTPDGAAEFERLAGNCFTAVSAADDAQLMKLAGEEAPEAVIINAALAGDNAPGLVKSLRNTIGISIPVAFTASEADLSLQEKLCSAGADDILIMPMCSQLLRRRLDMLIRSSSPSYENKKFCDFDKLIETVSEKTEAKGSFSVRQTDFANIYKFIARGLERSEKSVQALMLTLSCDENAEEQGIEMLSDAVKICLRKGDISSVCSKNQVVVLLIGADDNGGHLVANRIVSNFYSECADDSFSLNYDIREVKMPLGSSRR